jgi:hypothetical protein
MGQHPNADGSRPASPAIHKFKLWLFGEDPEGRASSVERQRATVQHSTAPHSTKGPGAVYVLQKDSLLFLLRGDC